MRTDPFDGVVYVFRAKRADRMKLFFWDGTGVCLFAKRLEEGEFRWPKIQDGVMRLTAAQLSPCSKDWIGGACARPNDQTPLLPGRLTCGEMNQGRTKIVAKRRGLWSLPDHDAARRALPDDPERSRRC